MKGFSSSGLSWKWNNRFTASLVHNFFELLFFFFLLCCLQVEGNIKRWLIIKQIISFSLKPATWVGSQPKSQLWRVEERRKTRIQKVFSSVALEHYILFLCIRVLLFSHLSPPTARSPLSLSLFTVIRLVSRCRRSKLENFFSYFHFMLFSPARPHFVILFVEKKR